MATEEQEIADLRRLIGDTDLDRLRPTGGTAGVNYPGAQMSKFRQMGPSAKQQVATEHPDDVRRQRLQKQHDLQDEDGDESDRPEWDTRPGQATPVRAEDMSAFKERTQSARREKYGSARYGKGQYTNQYVSRKEALQWYHREMEDHTLMWRMRQEANAAYKAPLYVAGDAWLQTGKELEERHRPPSRAASPNSKHAAFLDQGQGGGGGYGGGGGQGGGGGGGGYAALADLSGVSIDAYAQAAGRRAAPPAATPSRARKWDLQEEGEVGGQDAGEAPKAHRGRRTGASQTSRAADRRHKGYGAAAANTTARGPNSSRWVPSGGWDSSPLRNTPYALRGAKPVTDEPWARDEALSRNMEEKTLKLSPGKARAGRKGANAKPPSAANVSFQPAWDSSKRTAWDN